VRAKKLFTVDQLAQLPTDKAIHAIGQMLDTLFASVNAVTPGPVAIGTKAGQLDGVWLTGTFTGTVDQTFAHTLGRAPKYLLEAMALLAPGETAGVYGEIQMTGATATAVTLRCQTSGKVFRVILF